MFINYYVYNTVLCFTVCTKHVLYRLDFTLLSHENNSLKCQINEGVLVKRELERIPKFSKRRGVGICENAFKCLYKDGKNKNRLS